MSTQSNWKTLQVSTDTRGVTWVELARPSVLNAFDETLIAELTALFEELNGATFTRVVVLTAQGKAFCAGADLRWMERAAAQSFEENLSDARGFARMMQVIYDCPKPVVASVHGAAFGGGVGLCCVCDIVVATPQAKFAVSEAKFGILPAVIGPYLINAVGKRHALRLALTAEIFDAHAAAHYGLVQSVVEPEALVDTVEHYIRQLLSNGPAALGEIKRLYAQCDLGVVDSGTRELTAQTIARVRSTEEAREGFAAFLSKRPAIWTLR